MTNLSEPEWGSARQNNRVCRTSKRSAQVYTLPFSCSWSLRLYASCIWIAILLSLPLTYLLTYSCLLTRLSRLQSTNIYIYKYIVSFSFIWQHANTLLILYFIDIYRRMYIYRYLTRIRESARDKSKRVYRNLTRSLNYQLTLCKKHPFLFLFLQKYLFEMRL